MKKIQTIIGTIFAAIMVTSIVMANNSTNYSNQIDMQSMHESHHSSGMMSMHGNVDMTQMHEQCESSMTTEAHAQCETMMESSGCSMM